MIVAETVYGRDVRGGDDDDSSGRYALWVSVHYDIIVIIIVTRYLPVTGAYMCITQYRCRGRSTVDFPSSGSVRRSFLLFFFFFVRCVFP